MIPYNDIDEYVTLLHVFVSGQIDGETFEQRYYSLFSIDTTIRGEPVFPALNDVFQITDWFYADPGLREQGDLDEEQLRDRARAALRVLSEQRAAA